MLSTKFHNWFLILFILLITTQCISQVIISPNGSFSATNRIYEESFESGIPLNWTAGNKGFGTNNILDEGWYYSITPTPTPNTGPNDASDGNGYMYFEVSGVEKPNSKDTLVSAEISLSSSNVMLIDILLYGMDVESLQINIISPNSRRTTIAYYTGAANTHNNPSDWQTAMIDLNNYNGENVRFEFIGTKNGNPLAQGDIAIDNLIIFGLNISTKPIPVLSDWGAFIFTLLITIIATASIKHVKISPKIRTPN